MMELIDRTKLPRTVTHYAETEYEVGFEEGQQSIIEAINDAPVIDAVTVVRCKDCNFFHKHKWCSLNDTNMCDEDFCSYGERKGGNSDEVN